MYIAQGTSSPRESLAPVLSQHDAENFRIDSEIVQFSRVEETTSKISCCNPASSGSLPTVRAAPVAFPRSTVAASKLASITTSSAVCSFTSGVGATVGVFPASTSPRPLSTGPYPSWGPHDLKQYSPPSKGHCTQRLRFCCSASLHLLPFMSADSAICFARCTDGSFHGVVVVRVHLKSLLKWGETA